MAVKKLLTSNKGSCEGNELCNAHNVNTKRCCTQLVQLALSRLSLKHLPLPCNLFRHLFLLLLPQLEQSLLLICQKSLSTCEHTTRVSSFLHNCCCRKAMQKRCVCMDAWDALHEHSMRASLTSQSDPCNTVGMPLLGRQCHVMLIVIIDLAVMPRDL